MNMEMPTSLGVALVVIICILALAFCDEPDLQDALVHWIMK